MMSLKPAPTSAPYVYYSAPRWFRYAAAATAVLVLCSCRADLAQPHTKASFTAQSAAPAGTREDPIILGQNAPLRDSQTAAPAINRYRHIPTYLTQDQIAQASSPIPGCAPQACNCSSCSGCAVRGPKDEYLCDGGDEGLPAGVRADYTVLGLEQEDTIAHYDTVDGRTVVTPSNKICIYAPRFGAVRRVVDLSVYNQSDAVGGMLQEAAVVKAEDRNGPVINLAQLEPSIHRKHQPPSLLRERRHPGGLVRDERVEAVVGIESALATMQLIHTGEVIGREMAEIAQLSLAAVTWAGDQAPQVALENVQAKAEVSVQSPGTIYHLDEPNDPKLRLCKFASTGVAQQGEEVEFTLRFDNIGNREIDNVTIVDNLTTRLEYVEDSQKSSVDADFFADANDAGSVVLRWVLKEPLERGKGGVIQFRCKVR